MTAICAVWSRDGRIDPVTAIHRMTGPLEQYGGDRTARWADDGVSLAIWQRATTPEDRCDREPELRDGIAVVGDVRLDNRDELIRSLELNGADAARLSDSALLRHAWHRWGERLTEHLLGDFAFVIWDAAAQGLFAARDPFGIRPLCYATVQQTLVVASMPEGLLALPEVPRELDEAQLATRLVVGLEDRARTFFRGIAMLPPAHTLRATRDRVEVARYWQPRRAEIRYRRDDEYIDHFREIFGDAVRARLRAVGGVSSMLSAGLDSGSVTAIAAQQLALRNERLTALTWQPRAGAHIPPVRGRIPVESDAAARVAERYANIEHRFVEAEDRSPLHATAAFAAAMNQPFRNVLNAPSFWATAHALRASGSRVLLHGQYGNYGMSYDGATALPWLVARGRWIRAAREVVALNRKAGRGFPGLALQTIGPFLPLPIHSLARRWRRGDDDGDADSAINPRFAERLDLRLDAQQQWRRRDLRRPPRDGQEFRWPESRWVDPGQVFKGMESVLGAEMRDPTMDMRVVEYCLAIPDDQFLRGGQSRWLIRRAMHGSLPDETLNERRRGLQAADWPRFVAPCRAEFEAVVDDIARSPLVREAIDLDGVRTLLDAWPNEWTARMRRSYGDKLLSALTVGGFIRAYGSAAQRGA